MATRDVVQRCIRTLAAAGYRPPPGSDPEAVEASWLLVFGDVENDTLAVAVAAWMRGDERGFWPLPGMIRRELTALQPDADVMAGQDWCSICKGVGYRADGSTAVHSTRECEPVVDPEAYRGRRTPFVPHPDPRRRAAIVAGVAAAGGFEAIGRMTEFDRQALRKSFLAGWRASWERQAKEASARAMLGGAQRLLTRQS